MPPAPIGQAIAERGWRQGAVLTHEVTAKLTRHFVHPGQEPPKIDEDDWLAVVSQTCDVVAYRLDAEPLVEVLHCRVIAKVKSEFASLRSTRRLDFKPNRTTHPELALSAHATLDRYMLPREVLADVEPDPDRFLDDVATRRVAVWYALRYTRPAWPESFVERVSNARREFEAAIQPLGDDIELRVAISPREDDLDDNGIYRVALFFVVDALIWENDAEAREAIHAAYAKFASTLSNCKGVNVDAEIGGVVSGGDFSWQATRSTEEWNFANLSHRD